MFILFLLYIFTFFINQDYETTTHILYVNTSSHEFCILIKVEENKNFDTDANIFVIFFLIYKFPLYLATLTNELFAADALLLFYWFCISYTNYLYQNIFIVKVELGRSY